MVVQKGNKNSNKTNSLIKVFITFLLSFNLLSATEENLQLDFDTDTFRAHAAQKGQKEWTFIVYIAADNDLRSFAARNIKQMAQVGSNHFINIVVQLDIRITGNKKITRRYYIENNKIYHVNAEDPHSQKMDSGDPNTLISCASWAINSYPAKNYALILWNHGTGIIDPETGRIINPAELFTFNPSINKLELDRTIGFLEFIHEKEIAEKGVCWDDSTGNYLTNQKLEFALREITTKLLNNKKLNIIGFDACLMSMIEVAKITKDYANIMVGSQEVELGAGWDYERVLRPFLHNSLSQENFAKHIVEMYGETYNKITNDYTQSALNLSMADALEKNIHQVALLLLDCLKIQINSSVKNAIQASRSKLLCTHFDEPSYLDLHHLYTNLQSNLKHFTFNKQRSGDKIRAELNTLLEEGKNIIKKMAFASCAGKNLNLAQGISIYFPERRIHSSYRKTSFAADNSWITLLTQYFNL